MIGKKRGLSDVVTVTLIILLAIAAVVIVWAFVRSTLEETGKEITGVCVTSSVKLLGICNATTGAVTVRNDGRETINVKLVYYATNAADSESETRDANDCIDIAPLVQQRCTPRDPDGAAPAGPLPDVPDFNGAVAGGAPARVGVAAVAGTTTCPVSTESVNCVP